MPDLLDAAESVDVVREDASTGTGKAAILINQLRAPTSWYDTIPDEDYLVPKYRLQTLSRAVLSSVLTYNPWYKIADRSGIDYYLIDLTPPAVFTAINKQIPNDYFLARLSGDDTIMIGNKVDDDSTSLEMSSNAYAASADLTSFEPQVENHDENGDHVERLLGSDGKVLLDQINGLIREVAAERAWPLQGIDVEYERDIEQADWEYVVVYPVFDCSFEKADQMLHQLYDHLDSLAEGMSEKERAIYEGMIHFDIKQFAGVSRS
jgi:hypothetical protein